MATLRRQNMRALKPLNGTSIPQESFPEAATQTFKHGAPVLLSVGYIQECGADPALILGIASRNGQNGATAGLYSQSVILAHPDTLFEANLDNASGTTASAHTDRGKNYGIAKHVGTGTWYVDSTDVTAKRVVIWGFWTGVQDGVQAAIGDLLHPCYFQFDPAYFQGSKTS